MYRYIFIFLVILPTLATGQSLKGNIFTWSAEQVYDLAADTLLAQQGKFISYSFDKFELVQRSGTFTFAVASHQGTWKDVSQPGQMIFNVVVDNAPGIITTGRDNQGIYLILDMTPTRPDGVKLKYIISSLILQ